MNDERDLVTAEVQSEINRLWAGEIDDISALAKLALSVQGETLKSGIEALPSLAEEYRRALESEKSAMVCCGISETLTGRYRDIKMMDRTDCDDLGGTVLDNSRCEGRSTGGGSLGGLLNDICAQVPCTVKDANGLEIDTTCDNTKEYGRDDIAAISITLKA